MKFSLGFSPCPNDTFIFNALVNKKIDTEGIEFELFLEDVETLNQWAVQGKLDISKISYGVLPLLLSHYELLDAGGALGKGVGPLLIAREPIALTEVPGGRIAIPGQRTTAHLLFSLAFPEARRKEFMVFSDIEDAVLSGTADCGVIIHENRFTYQQRDLVKLLDLGEYWEHETGAPIPLGGIVFRKGHDAALSQKINSLIRKSLEYAFDHYPELPEFVRSHAQEMDERVMRQHIDLYVNNYSLSLGEDGAKAVRTLLQTYERIHQRVGINSL
ncbi:MAG TPA: 1,4-dihydroxy-6-naphthoate synthase [Puia sp.]|uniref:1,4-dihydroxy-6-naphthoate synthase n=1 Tax=Puia sp. TaxID=2045100 RepID=UPI002BC8A051|nr:1,4-dihydroxy-6-naphthoate synthase [Puia sp.]HVU93792.1 1,4-dihydroxy-6-naphthoate synthase [Puia sp.]